MGDAFVEILDQPDSRDLVEQFGPHGQATTFTLTMTSLRGTDRLYDRLENIKDGTTGSHTNFYSDPKSLGLIVGTSSSTASLTPAGSQFLSTITVGKGRPRVAEYELCKALYSSGHDLGDAGIFLKGKRDNLEVFLRHCRPTPQAHLIASDGRLLALAEIITSFGSALERFLQLDPSLLVGYRDLGEPAFRSLFEGRALHQGYTNVCRRISSGYTRTKERRFNYLVAQCLLDLRKQFIQRGVTSMTLVIPFPFSNLLSSQDIHEAAGSFTSDIVVYPDGGSFVVASTEVLTAQPANPPQQLGVASQRGAPRQPGTTGAAPPSPRTRSAYTVDAPLAKEAEDYVERLLRAEHGDSVRRIGHTSDELILLSDGLLPGADLLIEKVGSATGSTSRYVEVKSSRGGHPRTIRLTAAELRRAIKCDEDQVPYDIYVVSFGDNRGIPEIALLDNFQEKAAGLMVEDFEGVELRIEYET